MNPDLRGRDLPTAFASGDFQIMLVANKYQTGFDQPLLSAMYVFKRLDGVAAVQTLSRLNRTYTTPSGERKTKTMVLDFVNDPADIRGAFEPYYMDARIETRSDPNIVHDLVAKLDKSNIYTQAEIDQAAQAYVRGATGSTTAAHSALVAAVTPARKRFDDARRLAEAENDRVEVDRLEGFRHDIGTFVRIYDFMSQVIDYGSADLEKHAIFLRNLARVLETNSIAEVDLSDVTLTAVKQIDKGTADIRLSEQGSGLTGITAAGSAGRRDPKLVALQDVINRLNELFGDNTLAEDQMTTFVEGLLRRLMAEERLVQQATVNTKKQFLESPDLAESVIDAVMDNQGASNKMAGAFYEDGQVRDELVRLVGALLYEWTLEEAADLEHEDEDEDGQAAEQERCLRRADRRRARRSACQVVLADRGLVAVSEPRRGVQGTATELRGVGP